MTYLWRYKTHENFSDILLNSDGEFLTSLCFEGSKDFAKHTTNGKEKFLSIFEETTNWLDIYFSGKNPDFTPRYKLTKLTDFQKEVTECELNIPFGKITTYGKIAEKIAKKHGISKMASRAVGKAVGSNPICIIIPCHRVIGSNNSLIGYGGGIKNKIELLKLEGNDTSLFSVPKNLL